MKKIILYYSLDNSTRIIAKTLAEELDSDIVEIRDLKDRNGFSNKLISIVDAFRETKTQIEPSDIDLSNYNLVYIGSPTWANKPSPAIITLIDSLDLKAKDIILFTSTSTTNGQATISRMSEKATSRGARVINSFVIYVDKNDESRIKKDTLKAISNLDLKLF